MKRQLAIVLFVVAALVAASFPVFAEKPSLPTQGSIPVFANFGAKHIATPTIVISPGQKFDIGTRLPVGTTGFTYDVWDSDILIGHTLDLATAPSKWVGSRIASGSQNNKWDNAGGGTVHLWATPNSTSTATVILGVAFGDWEVYP